MNLFTGESSDAFFGGEVPPAVRALLHQAAATVPAERGALLWTAQAVAPQALAVYYALYKHHATYREFDLAERAAWRGLREAALQAGWPEDWRAVQPPLPVAQTQDGPGRFWAFTLKALCFIHLRTGRMKEARELLAWLQACAPEAQVGDEVIAALLDATPWREV